MNADNRCTQSRLAKVGRLWLHRNRWLGRGKAVVRDHDFSVAYCSSFDLQVSHFELLTLINKIGLRDSTRGAPLRASGTFGASGNLHFAVERGVEREWPFAAGVDLRCPTTFITSLGRLRFLSIR